MIFGMIIFGCLVTSLGKSIFESNCFFRDRKIYQFMGKMYVWTKDVLITEGMLSYFCYCGNLSCLSRQYDVMCLVNVKFYSERFSTGWTAVGKKDMESLACTTIAFRPAVRHDVMTSMFCVVKQLVVYNQRPF